VVSFFDSHLRELRYLVSEGASFPCLSTRLRQDGYAACLSRLQYACTLGSKQPSTLTRHSKIDKFLNNDRLFFANLNWEAPDAPSLLTSKIGQYIGVIESSDSLQSIYINQAHPLILVAKSATSKEDNPTWWQAMNGPYEEHYFKAAKVEIMTLEGKDLWIVVECTNKMNVLPSTWVFKLKRFPDGSAKKFKGCFCALGDKQIQGIDFFETYSPVVQWTTIRLMLILECVLGLVSKQGDVTCAFLHAILPNRKCVYIKMPHGFKQYKHG
jgi:hypothetical protein